MTKIKYLLCPGPMPSIDGNSTGQVSYMQLIASYGVDASECVIYHNRKDCFKDFKEDLLLLIPRRYPKDYKLSTCSTIAKLMPSGFIKPAKKSS